MCSHTHSHTQHTNWDFLCFAASRKKHPDVSSLPTTLPEYRGALWCRKLHPTSLLNVWETHTHTHIPQPCCSAPYSLSSAHVQLSRHGSLGQTISLHLCGMKCHGGEWQAKLASEIISFCLQMCLFASLSSSSSFSYLVPVTKKTHDTNWLCDRYLQCLSVSSVPVSSSSIAEGREFSHYEVNRQRNSYCCISCPTSPSQSLSPYFLDLFRNIFCGGTEKLRSLPKLPSTLGEYELQHAGTISSTVCSTAGKTVITHCNHYSCFTSLLLLLAWVKKESQ